MITRGTGSNGDELGGPVLVLGGTGNLGWHVVKALAAREHPVRVLSRSAAHAREVVGPEPEVIEGDITTQRGTAQALDGAGAVVVAVSAFSRSLIRRQWEIEHDAVLSTLERAGAAGVRRVVYLSIYEYVEALVERFNVETGRIKRAVERAIAATDLDWTVLGCPPSMEIFFAFTRGDRMVVPGGGPPALPTISGIDVGQIAAQAALRRDLGGERFRMAGPEALSFPEAARRLSAALGREIHFKKIPLAVPRVGAALIGPFVPYVRHLVATLAMMNNFPEELAAQVPEDHGRLTETFTFTPTTLEMEAQRRMA